MQNGESFRNYETSCTNFFEKRYLIPELEETIDDFDMVCVEREAIVASFKPHGEGKPGRRCDLVVWRVAMATPFKKRGNMINNREQDQFPVLVSEWKQYGINGSKKKPDAVRGFDAKDIEFLKRATTSRPKCIGFAVNLCFGGRRLKVEAARVETGKLEVVEL